MRYLLVALGAAFGAPTRFLIDARFRKITDQPFGIFFINILGSFFLGLTLDSPEHWHDLLAIGFLGAFTTWSTFILDIYLAYELKKYKAAAINLSASLICGLAAAWCGLQIGN
ncbi:MAG: fluoride efflux transporter FluC [Candidatus Planktophila sp.]